jgi:hypothetical protein
VKLLKIDKDTIIADIIEKYPFILEFMPTLSPLYERLKDREMMEQMGKIATLEMISQMGSVDLQELIEAISGEIEKRSKSEKSKQKKKSLQ